MSKGYHLNASAERQKEELGQNESVFHFTNAMDNHRNNNNNNKYDKNHNNYCRNGYPDMVTAEIILGASQITNAF